MCFRKILKNLRFQKSIKYKVKPKIKYQNIRYKNNIDVNDINYSYKILKKIIKPVK